MRMKHRPKEPINFSCPVNLAAIDINPEYLVADIKIENEDGLAEARHLVFATPMQLNLFKKVQTIYLDGTFKAVNKKLFKQLFSIHAFVRCEDNVKQIPLINVMMSRRSRKDYTAVFTYLKTHFLSENSTLDSAVLDFEVAVWLSLKECFPGIELRGCGFHWSQAIYRQAQELHLGPAYLKGGSITDTIKKLLALPFLPHRLMEKIFKEMMAEASAPGQDDRIVKLLFYVNRYWFSSPVWSPKNFCLYQRLVRTNNDLEGYHSRLNKKLPKHNPAFYVLIPILYAEAQHAEVTCSLISNHHVKIHRCKKTRDNQARLCLLWDQLEDHSITAEYFLSEAVKFVSKPSKS